MDPLTIAIHGRWSSNAILTYLAEFPLQCMRVRMKPQLDPRPDEADKPLWKDPQLLDGLRALEN